MKDTKTALEKEVTALRAQVNTLTDKQTQLELVIKSTGVGIWDWYVQTGETIFNERWANIIGYTLDELSPVSIQTWLDYAHPDDLVESERLLKEHWAGKSDYYIFESRMKHKDGHWIWVLDTGQVIEWESEGVPKRMIGTHLDITQKRENIEQLNIANTRLKQLSYLDSLLNIPNRRAYQEALEREISRAKRENTPISMLMVDVDHFKRYNDSYGHLEGDKALARVACNIRQALNRGTDLVARYGGEEFVVLLPGTQLEGAIHIAQQIKQQIEDENIEHKGSPHSVLTVSIGVSTAVGNFDNLLQQADMAMYRAKQSGRNCYEIYQDNEPNKQVG
ncbi:sensor domain-containing diguanylate cyclase [Enterovibrio paralichthyis]|uniref:sensor domain-containing diguanylate cyclase n=1 Tax=Enterovibrio paralichthyis TaxID=2853805 RepID=UPI001C458272|nr:sensor domain-containing diguanylate cyclase [Enterovibrio paralichthyis]MBV7300474.1 sensor domain-containing diguanylate cyclase [Enterovibrio paralichthyis]